MALHEMFEKIEDNCTPDRCTVFNWQAKSVGFGQFYFSTEKDGTVHCDNEGMSKAFIKRMLCQMVDNAVMSIPNKKDEK